MSKQFDAVIVGAGMIGLAAALGFARQGLTVAVVDKSAPANIGNINANEPTYSNRVSAINHSSQALLETLGVWSNIARKQPYTDMHVWEHDGFGDIQFSHSDSKRPVNHLGCIVENSVIVNALSEALKQCDKVSLHFESTIITMQNNDSNAQIVLNNGQILSCKLLLGADGANSLVRRSFGLPITFNDYQQQAIICNVTTEYEHKNTARQVFTEYGPLAVLPLPSANASSIVFSQSTEQAEYLMSLDERDFANHMRSNINNLYGEMVLSTPRQSIDLTMRYARQWVLPHVALIGDAAHTIHPLAGLGANLGFDDVAQMLSLVERYPDCFSEHFYLRKYERARKSQAIKTIAMMEGFKRGFSNSDKALKFIRNSGLKLANHSSFLKRLFLQQAS